MKYGVIQLLSGNSNFALSKNISKYLKLNLGNAKVAKFSDSEISVQINQSIRGADVFVMQGMPSPANDNLMELLIMLDALKRASASRITAVIPYFGYARQDRKTHPREPITAKLVADLISVAGADRVISVDLHSGQIQGFFDFPVDNLTAVSILADDFRKKKLKDVVVVSPDVGGVVRARAMGKLLSAPLAIIEKRREKANESEALNVIGDVDGKVCVLVDDIIDTAGTMCNGAVALKNKGATAVYAYGTHGVLSGPAIDRLRKSEIKEIVITDTIPLHNAARNLKKIRQVSVAQLIGEAIKRTHFDKSVSSLFKNIGKV
ncbi:ribose-phosphate pyrophosphokinase [Candidatus Micrarchaeota archaeon]|nr:ribose-phosphate pyrophosphokinase [Candidatus Micrarchaeota archaeon]